MQFCLRTYHPISNPNGPDLWDGKIYVYDGDRADLDGWVRVVERIVKFKMNREPGYTRFGQNGLPVFFPARRRTGVHCIIIEEVSS